MNESTTVIGERTTINGNLEGDEDLVVHGRVEGGISLKHTLTIEPTGVVVAEVQVRNAVVSGVMAGNITAEDAVHITAQGRMIGDIRAPRVIIVDGASFRGSVDMGDLDMPRSSGSADDALRPAPVAARRVPQAISTGKSAVQKEDGEEAVAPKPKPASRPKPAAKRKPAPKSKPAPKRKPAAKGGSARKPSAPAKSKSKPKKGGSKKKAPAPRAPSVGRRKKARKR